MEPVASRALAKLRCLAAALRTRHGLTINKVTGPQFSVIHSLVALKWKNTKEKQLLLYLLKCGGICRCLSFHCRIIALIGNHCSSTLGEPLRNPPWLKKWRHVLSTKALWRLKRILTKLLSQHIQPLGNTWALSPRRTALPVFNVLATLGERTKCISMCLCVPACTSTWVYISIRGRGVNRGSWDMRAGRGGVKLFQTAVMFFPPGGKCDRVTWAVINTQLLEVLFIK